LYDKVRPDLVLLAFSEDNDIDENIVWNPNVGVFPETGEISREAVEAYRQGLRSVTFQDALFRRSALVRFFRQRHLRASVAAEVAALDARLEAHGLANAPLGRMVADEARRRFLQAFGSKYDDDWRVTEILLERVRRFVADRGAKLVLLRIPSRTSLDDAAWTEARHRFCGSEPVTAEKACGALDRAHTSDRLRAFATANQLAYIDPADELRAALERRESVYLPGDIHLSRLGHLRVGERLARDLVPILGGKLAGTSTSDGAKYEQRKVGAYWYPWYRAKDWRSFTDYTPRGGAYLSTDLDTVRQQLHWAERAEIDFVMIELLADHNPESKFNNQAVDALVRALVERRRRGHSRLGFAVLSDIFVGEADIATSERWLEVTRRHLDQIWTRFVEPYPDAYLRVDGKPLLGIFSPPVAIDDARYTIVRPYWVAHEQWPAWSRKSELVPFWDTAPQFVTDRRFMSVVPGYNDWRLERQPQVGPYLPRLGGRTLVEQWQRVLEIDPEVVLVYSYNEYFEQTQIEPTVEQGDRYLILNQLLARRFKDGRKLDPAHAKRLPEILEPPLRQAEEKVAWLPIDDPRLVRRGLLQGKAGQSEFHDRAELELDVDSQQAFVVGIAHRPSFDRCAGLSVSLATEGEPQAATFGTELTQLSILRDLPQPKTVGRVKLSLQRVKAAEDCPDGGSKPIVVTGVVRYPLATAERQNFRVDEPTVKLEGFWSIEKPPSGAFVWSAGKATVHVSGLKPGVRYRVTLTFRDTANFGNLQLGPDFEHLQKVVITPGRTATFPEPLGVSPAGSLSIGFQTPTWRPSELFGSEDQRSLGLALRLITLDRVDGAIPAHARQ
jgi:hypothetical protein